jgi:hypothetical protein
LWQSPPRLHQSASLQQGFESNKDYIRWLIINVLGEPERLNSYMEMRLIKDLNFNATTTGLNGLYYNDNSMMSNRTQYHPFSAQDAYNQMKGLCDRRNFWEKFRCGIK